jgi:hypothetical protein
MKQLESVTLKGSHILKAEAKLVSLKCHPEWWGLTDNFVMLMTEDRSVHLAHVTIKPGLSTQNINLDPKPLMDWVQAGTEHMVCGINDSELWVCRLT